MLKSPESVRVKGVGGLRKKNNALIRANWWKLRQLPRGRGGGGGGGGGADHGTVVIFNGVSVAGVSLAQPPPIILAGYYFLARASLSFASLHAFCTVSADAETTMTTTTIIDRFVSYSDSCSCDILYYTMQKYTICIIYLKRIWNNIDWA